MEKKFKCVVFFALRLTRLHKLALEGLNGALLDDRNTQIAYVYIYACTQFLDFHQGRSKKP